MKRFSLLIFLSLISFSCKKSDNWVSLLNENDLKGWHYYNDNGNKIGWSVENGILSFDPTLAKFKRDQDGNTINDENGNPKIERNDIVTDLDYENFKIYFEWKVDSLTNSGFMWGVSEDKKYEHPHVTGPEIQIIDANTYGNDPEHQIHTVGALYDMVPPKDIVAKNAEKIKPINGSNFSFSPSAFLSQSFFI